MQKAREDMKLKEAAFWIIFIVSAIVVAESMIWFIKALYFPLPLSYPDSIYYYLPLSSLYKNLSTMPYIPTEYTPISYMIFDAVKQYLQVTGAPFFAARLLTLIEDLIAAMLVYLVSRRVANAAPRYSLLAALFFLTAFPIFLPIESGDPIGFELIFDMLALLALKSKMKSSTTWAAAFVALAFFSKQTAIVFFIAILAYFAVERKWHNAAIFTASFLLFTVPIVLWLNSVTSGVFLLSILSLPLNTPFGYPFSLIFFYTIFAMFTLLVPLLLSLRKNALSANKLLAIITALEFISTLDLMKFGSNVTYLLLPFTFACVMGAASLQGIGRQGKSKLALAKKTTIIFLFVIFGISAYLYFQSQMASMVPTTQQQQAVSILRNAGGTALVTNIGYAYAAGQPTIEELTAYFVFQKIGVWNDSQLVSYVKEQRFSVIEMDGWQAYMVRYPGLQQAINSSYALKYNISGIYLYFPKNESNSTA